MDRASAPTPAPPPPVAMHDAGAMPHIAGSCVLHLGLLLVAALVGPSLTVWPADGDREGDALPTYASQAFFTAVAEPEDEEPRAETAAIDPDGRERTDSRCGERKGGSMGDPAAAETGHRYGVQGPTDNPDPHIAQEEATRDDEPVWPIGPLRPGRWGGARNEPLMPAGRDDSLGNDPTSARGNLWGEMIGEAAGSPGAGIGLRRLCETCGSEGRGVQRDRGHRQTTGGGLTPTEEASQLLVKRRHAAGYPRSGAHGRGTGARWTPADGGNS